MKLRTAIKEFGAFILAFCMLQPVAAEPIKTMGEAINQAGRQRMLTQRIVKAYCQIGQDIRYDVATQQLSGSAKLFEKQLDQLTKFTDSN